MKYMKSMSFAKAQNKPRPRDPSPISLACGSASLPTTPSVVYHSARAGQLRSTRIIMPETAHPSSLTVRWVVLGWDTCSLLPGRGDSGFCPYATRGQFRPPLRIVTWSDPPPSALDSFSLGQMLAVWGKPEINNGIRFGYCERYNICGSDRWECYLVSSIWTHRDLLQRLSHLHSNGARFPSTLVPLFPIWCLIVVVLYW